MDELLVGLSGLSLPRFLSVRQHFPEQCLSDVGATVARELNKPAIAARLKPGTVAAIAVGSRGIANLTTLTRTLVIGLQERGVRVFIVPAMGSHGGGTADGQRQVLADYGVTAESTGAPIVSSMEAHAVGAVRFDEASNDYVEASANDPKSLPIYLDRSAFDQADLIIPIVRVKPHTGFRGRYESGICKMLTIGLGKHIGCSRMHREGFTRFAALIPAAAKVTIASGKIGFALAAVENAYERTAHVEAVAAEDILAREPALLEMARSLMPRLLLPRIDVLVIDEIGKDISGTGMDGNIVGRSELGRLANFNGPEIRRIAVLGLTAKTHGNATGIGLADIITERAYAAIDRKITYTNVLTSGSLGGGKIPVALPTDQQAMLAAASCVPGVEAGNAGMVRIKNTLSLGHIAVSENLLPIVQQTEGMTVMGPFSGNWEE